MTTNSTLTDRQLLARHVAGDPAAFGEIVRRHVHLVHAAARRQAGDAAADDITQAVFLLLHQKAHRLTRHDGLAGWLHRAAGYCAANARKIEARRRRHEREAAMLPTPAESASTDRFLPLLDDALSKLAPADREALLLRYLEGKSIHDTARLLTLSPTAAAKRAERALARLRTVLGRHGAPAAAIPALLTAEAARLAPAHLPDAVLALIHAGTPAAGILTLTKGASNMMAWHTTTKTALAAVALATTAALAFLAVHAYASDPPKPAPRPPAAVAPLLPLPPGDKTLLAVWDVMTDDDGSAAIAQALTRQNTTSNPYTAYLGNADKLRAAIANVRKRNHLVPGKYLHVYDPATPTQVSGLFGAGNRSYSAIFTWKGTPEAAVAPTCQPNTAKVSGNTVRVNVDHDINIAHGPLVPGLKFTGDLAVGNALVFIGPITTKDGTPLHHVAVCEALRARTPEFEIANDTPFLEDLLDHGVEGLRRTGARALLWSKAGHKLDATPPNALQQELPGGIKLTLAAVSRPDTWLFCWWDAAGQPVAYGTNDGFFNDRRDPRWRQAPWAAVWRASCSGWDKLPAAEREAWSEATSPIGPDIYTAIADRPMDRADEIVEIGVSAGPWRQAGPIELNKSLTINGATATFHQLHTTRKSANVGGATTLWCRWTGTTTEFAISAKSKHAGKIYLPPAPVRIELEMKTGDQYYESWCPVPEDTDNLDSFILWTRPRHWTTWRNWAAQPTLSPDALPLNLSPSTPRTLFSPP